MTHRLVFGQWLVVALACVSIAGCSAGAGPSRTPDPCSSPHASGVRCGDAPDGQGGTKGPEPTSGPASGTPGQSKAPGGALPKQWSGMVAFEITADPRVVSDAGYDEYGNVTRTGVMSVVFERDSLSDATKATWESVSGGIIVNASEEIWQGDAQAKQREIMSGQGYAKIDSACELSTADGGKTYSLACQTIIVEGFEYTLFEPNEPGNKMEGGDQTVHTPNFKIDGIAGGAGRLDGSRTVETVVEMFSRGAKVDANIRWSLIAGDGGDPKDRPLDLQPLTLGGEPMPISLDGSARPLRLGLPLLKGQTFVVRVTGNAVGKVGVEVIDPESHRVAGFASEEAAFETSPATAAMSGVYSILVDAGDATSGGLTLAVTAP